MSGPPGNKPKSGKGRFKPGQSGNPDGRPKKSVQWKKAEHELREALPRLMLMRQNDLRNLLSDNPRGYEIMAAKFITEYPKDAVDRMLGKTPNVVTGADGAPLIPEPPEPGLPPFNFAGWSEARLNAFVAATSSAAKGNPAAPKVAPPPK